MVDFQSRDTRRGFGGSEDDDEADEEEAAEEPASESEAEEPTADEPSESDDGESTEEDETAVESAEAPEPADDPLAAESESDDGPAADAAADEQPARAGPVESKAAAGSQAESSTQPASTDVQAAVVTIGTAGEDSDPTGDQMVAALERAGHGVTARERLRGDFDGVQQSVDALVGRDDVDVVVTAGGTGIRDDEIAIEAVHPLLEKALPGFGEAFRTLLFDHVGTGIVAVRTTAGIAKSTPVFCLPGDRQAAALGVEEIVAPEAGELVAHLQSE